MKKFDVVVADPPWFFFFDGLKMSDVKRSAQSQYDTLSIDDIKNLPISKIAEDDSVLVLWVPSSFLQEGLDTMRAWGFNHKQTHVWVKTKKSPLGELAKEILQVARNTQILKNNADGIRRLLDFYDISSILAFGMGRLFRQTHELALVGTRGKVYSKLKSKSQRSVHFGPVTKHSAKPEDLQDMLDTMFPGTNKIELFARRERQGWSCYGNECPSSFGEDIRDSLKSLMSKKDFEEHYISVNSQASFRNDLIKKCKSILRKKVNVKKVKSFNVHSLDDLDPIVGDKNMARLLLDLLRQK